MCAGSVRQVGHCRDGRVMLEKEVNFLGRQRDLGKQVFVRVRHAEAAAAVFCRFGGVGATDDVFVTAYLTDDLMSRLQSLTVCR